MSDTETLTELLAVLNRPGLKKAMAHPEWAEAYAAVLDNQCDQTEGLYDLGDDVQFVHVLSVSNFDVDEKGRLVSEDLTIPTEPYVWINGEWTNDSENEEEEEEEEEENDDE